MTVIGTDNQTIYGHFSCNGCSFKKNVLIGDSSKIQCATFFWIQNPYPLPEQLVLEKKTGSDTSCHIQFREKFHEVSASVLQNRSVVSFKTF